MVRKILSVVIPRFPDGTPTITLYALDEELNLKTGFYLNELYDAMDGHVLKKAVLKAKYVKE